MKIPFSDLVKRCSDVYDSKKEELEDYLDIMHLDIEKMDYVPIKLDKYEEDTLKV